MASLVRFSPLRDMLQLQSEMNRLFSSAQGNNQEELLSTGWAPQVDIYEDADGIRLHADLPGVNETDLDIQIDNGMLTIRGERKLDREDQQENYHRIERYFGHFSRSFMLPDYADVEKVDARFKNGVLEVTIPKKAEKKPRSVKVKVH